MRYAFPARAKKDEADRWTAIFPDIPEALTDSSTREGALHEAAGALGAALAGYVIYGRSIPEPSPLKRGQTYVSVPLLVAAKLALHQAMAKDGISNVELARRLGVSEGAVRRLVDPDHKSKIEKVEAALMALGRKAVLEAE